ncbi:hypothetical protein CY34DRAFT_9434 [Suillus luteus UH-Slu-Lm8-n1]|uniref:Uncharacterized protein n=1 Tax=Suillus luteus UH-Slu-Lm8-n1 TaxID=930992 RepID=A0A0D0BLU8_9AGAM|nr:hypothetical protein CY34DRAFT_9434 [Suillus luteus UH-Slu-Lm8-n1]
MALCHLYCNCILQGNPTYGSLSEGRTDYDVFREMFRRTEVNGNVLVAIIKLVIAENGSPSWWASPTFGTCLDSVLEWLSHVLPFHFVTGQVDKEVEKLATTVISKLLCSASSPSPQIIANCTLLACVMVGVHFDKKDIVRVDKSSALPQLVQFLWAQFQKVHCASDGGDLDSTVRRTWHFDVICRVVDSDLPDLLQPLEMWNLGMCRKMYSRARSSEQNDRDSSVQRLRVAVIGTRQNLPGPATRAALPAFQALQARALRATPPAFQALQARALPLEGRAALQARAPLQALPALAVLVTLAGPALGTLRAGLETLAVLPTLAALTAPEAPASPASPAWLWQHQISWQDHSHLPEDFDWLMDYLSDVPFDDYATAGDILVLLSSMRVSCSPTKKRLYVEKLIACMDSSMPARFRHAALRAAHNSREALASIDVVDDTDMVLTKFSLAILSAVCPQPGVTPTEDDPDCFFHGDRDLCYLELIFVLAKNSAWHSHLSEDGHIDRCSCIISKSCDFFMDSLVKGLHDLQPHAFFLAGIFLQTTSAEVSVTSLRSITEQQWWNMMRMAWYSAFLTINNTHDVEFLPVLVEGTKKYIYIASKPELEGLIRRVDDLIERMEGRGLLEGVTAVKKLRGIVNDNIV